MFYLISWNEFEGRKTVQKAEIVSSENIELDLKQLMQFNGQKRLTTTDYRFFNLSELLLKNELEIVEKASIITEDNL